MTRIGIVGATGRTGRYALAAVLRRGDCSLGAAIVSPGSSKLSHVVAETALTYSSRLEDLAECDVVIDFSTPDVSGAVVEMCVAHRIALLVATTGHSPSQLDTLRTHSARIPLALVPNTSLGAATLSLLAREAKRMLGTDFDIEVMEIHHRMKRDAPSGTALAVIEHIQGDSRVVFGREGQRQADEVGVSSLRGGDVVGDHTVYFLGQGERVEITHRVSTRDVFGSGAVRLAMSLVGRAPGQYRVTDLL